MERKRPGRVSGDGGKAEQRTPGSVRFRDPWHDSGIRFIADSSISLAGYGQLGVCIPE